MPIYRVTTINKVVEGNPYAFEGGDSVGHTVKTRYRLELQHGIDKRTFRMDVVSNAPFSDNEVC